MISHYEGSNLKRQNCRKDMEASLVRERETEGTDRKDLFTGYLNASPRVI